MIKSYAAMSKISGDLFELIPVYPKHVEDMKLEKLDGYDISISYSGDSEEQEPAAYFACLEDRAVAIGPEALQHIEILGDL